MSGSQQLLLGEGAGGGGASVVYIENVSSTYVYTGTGSALTITNNIDLSTKGGLAWIKSRTTAFYHNLFDTVRGVNNRIFTPVSDAQVTTPDTLTAFNTTGFSVGASGGINTGGDSLASWTFREQSKFFDVVTYTGNGAGGGQVISHNLGSTPGLIICKPTSAVGDWAVCARTGGASSPVSSITYATGLSLNSTGAALYSGTLGNYPTSTTFDTAGIFDNPGNYPNSSGVTYVAYLFAHDAGGFGLTGTDNVISCGSYTGNGSTTGPTVTLGYEPQWLMVKKVSAISGSESWAMWDNMRSAGLWDDWLIANSAQIEQVSNNNVAVQITATGFYPNAANNSANSYVNTSGSTYIYIAIRRGPMAVPTVGTSVYSQTLFTGDSSSNRAITTGFPVDTNLTKCVTPGANWVCWAIRKIGTGMNGSNTDNNQYQPLAGWIAYDNNTQLVYPTAYQYNNNNTYIYLTNSFGRAPKFHDVQVWKGTGGNLTVGHCLTIPPELVIIKNSTASSQDWVVYSAISGANQYQNFNTTAAVATFNYFQNTTPTSTDFYVSSATQVNGSTDTMQAMMWATCPGVSKVGSYTGTGGAQTINCAFTTGARFVMIKRTDSTGGWYIFSTAMGMSSGSSPYYFANSDAAYVTGVDYINTTGVGFDVTSSAPSGLNGSGGTFLFLAIA
jgi:hypothetical protein